MTLDRSLGIFPQAGFSATPPSNLPWNLMTPTTRFLQWWASSLHPCCLPAPAAAALRCCMIPMQCPSCGSEPTPVHAHGTIGVISKLNYFPCLQYFVSNLEKKTVRKFQDLASPLILAWPHTTFLLALSLGQTWFSPGPHSPLPIHVPSASCCSLGSGDSLMVCWEGWFLFNLSFSITYFKQYLSATGLLHCSFFACWYIEPHPSICDIYLKFLLLLDKLNVCSYPVHTISILQT